MTRGAIRNLIAALAFAATAVAGDEALKPKEFTLGLVQKELREGLSQTEVVERLGAPNIVTRGASGREAWVYDKVATESATESRTTQGGGVIGGASPVMSGLVAMGGSQRSETTRHSQKTLTLVVRFTPEGAVESFSWRSSRF